jgi:hypothetical protein
MMICRVLWEKPKNGNQKTFWMFTKTAFLVFNRYKNRPFCTVQKVRKKDGFFPSNLNAKN